MRKICEWPPPPRFGYYFWQRLSLPRPHWAHKYFPKVKMLEAQLQRAEHESARKLVCRWPIRRNRFIWALCRRIRFSAKSRSHTVSQTALSETICINTAITLTSPPQQRHLCCTFACARLFVWQSDEKKPSANLSSKSSSVRSALLRCVNRIGKLMHIQNVFSTCCVVCSLHARKKRSIGFRYHHYKHMNFWIRSIMAWLWSLIVLVHSQFFAANIFRREVLKSEEEEWSVTYLMSVMFVLYLTLPQSGFKVCRSYGICIIKTETKYISHYVHIIKSYIDYSNIIVNCVVTCHRTSSIP